jgi:hypothetical protein
MLLMKIYRNVIVRMVVAVEAQAKRGKGRHAGLVVAVRRGRRARDCARRTVVASDVNMQMDVVRAQRVQLICVVRMVVANVVFIQMDVTKMLRVHPLCANPMAVASDVCTQMDVGRVLSIHLTSA